MLHASLIQFYEEICNVRATLRLTLLGGNTVHSVRYFSYSGPAADLEISVEIKNTTLSFSIYISFIFSFTQLFVIVKAFIFEWLNKYVSTVRTSFALFHSDSFCPILYFFYPVFPENKSIFSRAR